MSISQQYFDFVTETEVIFERYPQLETLRYFVFKELLINRKSIDFKDVVKNRLRPLLRTERTAAPPSEADVLILVETPRKASVEALLRVYQQLLSRGIRVQLVSVQDTSGLPASTVRFRYPARSAAPAWAAAAWGEMEQAMAALRDLSLKRAFLDSAANAQALMDEMERLVSLVKPQIVLIWATQMPGGAALAVTARKHQIMSLLLQHGLIQPFFKPVISDWMATWGETSNAILRDLGVPPEQLIPLGSPRHDSMFPVGDGRARSTLLQSLSLPDRPTLAFFSNGNDLVVNGAAPVECAAWLEAAAAQYADEINVVVRLHPNEDGSLYANCPHLCLTKTEIDLSTMLEGCDWVGSIYSTVLYEALLYGKPTWQFYADSWPDLVNNWREGLAQRIASQADFSACINSMLNAGLPELDQSLADRVFANRGRAAAAVADFLQQLLQQDKAGRGHVKNAG